MKDRLSPEGLRYVQAVARAGSFSATAREYGLTQPALLVAVHRIVKLRVLWRLVYLVVVVVGCGCSWRFWLTSGAREASCSAGGTHTDGGVWPGGARTSAPTRRWRPRAASMSSHGPWLKDELGLVQGVQRLSQGIVIGVPLSTRLMRPPRSRTEPADSEWTCTPRSRAVHQAREAGLGSFPLPDGHLEGIQSQVGDTGRQVVCQPMIRREYTSVTKAT